MDSNKIQLNIVIVLLAALIALTAYQSFNSPTSRQSWEYKIESVPDANFEAATNLLGRQGWEIVSARRASNGEQSSPTFSYEMILRRPASGAPLIPIKAP